MNKAQTKIIVTSSFVIAGIFILSLILFIEGEFDIEELTVLVVLSTIAVVFIGLGLFILKRDSMPPPNPKQEPQAIPSFYKVQEKEISQIRPWVRFWARMFDLQLYSFFGGFILSIVAPSAADMPLIILSVLFVSTWVLVEPVLLSSWGTTPGKWLLKTTVRNSKGEKLGFLDALYRSFLVWVIGLGMGLPLIYLITLLIAYGRLIRKGITFWDRKGSFVILHNRIGPIRVIVTILFFIGILLLLVYSKELGRSSM